MKRIFLSLFAIAMAIWLVDDAVATMLDADTDVTTTVENGVAPDLVLSLDQVLTTAHDEHRRDMGVLPTRERPIQGLTARMISVEGSDDWLMDITDRSNSQGMIDRTEDTPDMGVLPFRGNPHMNLTQMLAAAAHTEDASRNFRAGI